ncbi:MAG: preprotein translocase subunit YajC [Planctomycetes bacterium]|nr:preprotein translocase subunit YajC [Planctomycetota bacterium]
MYQNIINALIFAQDAPAQDASGGLLSMVLMIGMLFVVMYFFMIRPQSKKQKALESMRRELSKNDKVMTTGGLIGFVTKIKDNEVVLKIDEGNNTRVTVVKGAIVHIIDRAETKEEEVES